MSLSLLWYISSSAPVHVSTCFGMFRLIQVHSRNVIVSYELYLNVQFCLNVQATVIEWRGVNVFLGVSAAVLCVCVLVCFGVHVSAGVIQRRSHRLLHVILWSIHCSEHWFLLSRINKVKLPLAVSEADLGGFSWCNYLVIELVCSVVLASEVQVIAFDFKSHS